MQGGGDLEWGDVESDTDSDEGQGGEREEEGGGGEEKREQVGERQWEGRRDDEERRRDERARFREEQSKLQGDSGAKQLKKLQELENENVWLLIYTNSNPMLQKCVEEIQSFQMCSNNVGWEVKVTKQKARMLISKGFWPQRVFAIIQVGYRNYPSDRRNEKYKDEKRRYVAKSSQEGEGGAVQSEYTFQKKKRAEGDRDRNQWKGGKQGRRGDGERGQRGGRKEEKVYFKNPVFQGSGDFRNKEVLQRTVSEKEPEKEQGDGAGLEEISIVKHVSIKTYDRPKYVEKQQKLKYRQKPGRSNDKLKETEPSNTEEESSHGNMIIPDSSPSISSAPPSPSKQEQFECSPEACETALTKNSSSISQQLAKPSCIQPENVQSQCSEPTETQPTETKPAKKKRVRNKQKAPKPISNNPFDKLG